MTKTRTRCMESDDLKKMSLRECLQRAGWDIRPCKNQKLKEAMEYFMYDFDIAGTPEDISAWQMSYTGAGNHEIHLQFIRPFFS